MTAEEVLKFIEDHKATLSYEDSIDYRWWVDIPNEKYLDNFIRLPSISGYGNTPTEAVLCCKRTLSGTRQDHNE